METEQAADWAMSGYQSGPQNPYPYDAPPGSKANDRHRTLWPAHDSPGLVWVVVYSHRHGDDVTVCATQQSAHDVAEAIVEENWPDEMARWGDGEALDIPADREEMMQRYFDRVEDEQIDIFMREVQP